jgi:hypothetical protein
MFFQLDMGSMMRPAGLPIKSKLYLIGSVITGQPRSIANFLNLAPLRFPPN